MKNNFRIFCALLWRDLKIMRQTMLGDLMDGAITMAISVITFGKLLPLIGMPIKLIAPLYIGSSLLFNIFGRGYALAMQIVYKIPYEGFGVIGYHMTLPICKWWVFAEYTVFFVIETAILTLPTLVLGTLILNTIIPIPMYSWSLFIGIYLLSLIAWGLFFISCAFVYTFEWFKHNVWTRRLDLLMVFSSAFFPWEMVYNFSPRLSYFFLCNPVTYMVEGMRKALLGTDTFPPFHLVIAVLIASIILCAIRLRHGVIKTLDPV